MRHARRTLAALGAAVATTVLVVGCAGPTQPPGPSTPPTSPAPTTATDGPTPTGPTGSGPSAPSTPSGTESAREAPTRATAPAPSTAGPLTAADLPTDVLGFRAQEREPTEGEYVPNGTWVHAVDGEQAAWEAMPSCEANTGGGWPQPSHALAGTYLNDGGRPGNALALQFASTADAQGYATTYRRVLASCPNVEGTPAVAEVATTGAWYVGRRDYVGERWSEIVLQRDDRVLLLIINDEHASTEDQLRGFAARLAEG